MVTISKLRRWYCHCVIVLVYLTFSIDAQESTKQLPHDRNRRQTEEGGCILPYHPEHGSWKLLVGEGQPGGKVEDNTVIKFECNSGYKLNSENSYRVCAEKWRPNTFPECERLCPPLFSSSTFELKCRDKTGLELNCTEAAHGAFVEYTCSPFYETPFGYKRTLLCEDGKWNQKPICHPVCGKKIVQEANSLIFGVKSNEKLEYPWVVALYQKINGSYHYSCGGSILSLTVVATAAHCVTNDYGDVLPKEDYIIGAGKLYSKYQAPEDTQAQYIEISKIIVHKDYRGDSRRFLADLAVLITKGEFVLDKVVQPVCFNGLNTLNLHPGYIGEVSGWGRAEDEEPSEKLRTLRIPYKYETTCAEELPSDWANRFNIIDKICAGFVNKSTSACVGDSGGGLAFKNPEDNRYYLHGIASIGVFSGDFCDIQQNSLYTKVAFYYEYIDRLLTLYAPEVKDCKLPPHPQNGKWTIHAKEKYPGDAVSSSTILRIECNEGFKLLTQSANISCSLAHNMPQCQALCPALNFPKGTDFKCIDKNGQPTGCSTGADAIKLWYSCPRGYRFPKGTSNSTTCTKGSWGSPPPECLPIVESCGVKLNTSDGLEYPWIVLIFKKSESSRASEGYEFACGGTLISHKVVLISSDCVTKGDGKVLPKENYLMAAGIVFNKYEDPRDPQAQYTDISDIKVHKSYRGHSRSYVADISLVIAKTPFVFNKFVGPACFYNVNNIQLHPGDIGVVWKYHPDKEEVTELVYKEYETCEREYPTDFSKQFQGLEKICGGLDNGTAGLCSGDGGKGFVFKNPEDGKYYIHGLASVTYKRGVDSSCHHNTLFTNVSLYYDFIDKILSEYE